MSSYLLNEPSILAIAKCAYDILGMQNIVKRIATINSQGKQAFVDFLSSNNNQAVNDRYNENLINPSYDAGKTCMLKNLSLPEYLSIVRCYQYQASDLEGYETSEIKKVIECIIDHICYKITEDLPAEIIWE